jgi:hypothetical protein
MQTPFSRSKCFPLIRLDLALHIVPRIRYLGFTTRGKNDPLTTTEDLSACKSKRTLIQLLTVNSALGRGDRELFVQRDGSSPRRLLRRRHEGYLRIDLLAATLQSNREVDVFVLRTARQIFSRPPTYPTNYGGVHDVRLHLHAIGRSTSMKVEVSLHQLGVRVHYMRVIKTNLPSRWIRIQGSNQFFKLFSFFFSFLSIRSRMLWFWIGRQGYPNLFLHVPSCMTAPAS